MRKKIFLIHGKGVRRGLGEESGGDLDTVSANAFYGIWMKELVGRELDGEPTYGEDYEFDFVNYQEGLQHLDVHQGCDLYLPDFPIDALAPRLQMHRLKRRDEVDERTKFHEAVNQTRKAFQARPDRFSGELKEIHNTLLSKSGKYLEEKKYYEITVARAYTEMLFGLVRQIFNNGTSSVVERLEDFLLRSRFASFRDRMEDRMESYVKRNLIDEIDQEHVRERLLLDDSASSDYGRLYHVRNADHLLGILVETISLVTGTYFLLPKLEPVTEPDQRAELREWCESLTDDVTAYLGELGELLDQVLEANPDHRNMTLIQDRCGELIEFFETFDYEFLHEDYTPHKDLFQVHVTEESTGRPVEDLEVVFNVSEGPVEISAVTHDSEESAKSLSVRTTEQGYAAVRISGVDQAEQFGVTATYDEMNFLSFPKNVKLSENYFEEHPDPDDLELQLLDYLGEGGDDSVESSSGNTDQIEEGTQKAGDRAVRVQQQMVERHLRYLDEQDVRLVRIDDHHPYTPEVLETLEQLKDEGLIESITLSSLPRGEHQDKEDQLCGTDLIYRQFIDGTEADNEGLQALCHATHLQDLHIEEDPMALELSKLIGSRYSKVKMARGLTEIESRSDYDSIMRSTGWDDVVTEYEQGLNRVLPRVDLTLHRLTFTIPPPGGDYETEVNWSPLKFPVQYFAADERQKQHLIREAYAEDSARTVTFFCALSPYCDPEKGEPQINVASAQNYLTARYDFDYLFYAYGSMLLSTRRVNEEDYDIDLSKLVSEIGSPSDGGHPGAATGSPESNPNFPQERFGKVDHKNFSEYLYYVAQYVEDHTGLDLQAIEEVYPGQFEAGVRDALRDLENQAYHLNLRGNHGVAKVLVANSVYTEEDEGDVMVPLACSHLLKTFPGADYVFYSVSASNLVLRNLDDERDALDLDEAARVLGTDRDGGHRRAASCKPRFNPSFPEEKFSRLNYETMGEYVEYLGNRLRDAFDFTERDVRKAVAEEPDSDTN